MELDTFGNNTIAHKFSPQLPSLLPNAAPAEALLQPSAYSMIHGLVMTDEQLETLRRQISVYATICQQLVEMHKAVMAQQTAIQGLRLGQSIPFDSAIYSNGPKLTSRQRWTPSQTQLQILEKLFEQGSGTPNKQRIKEITGELSQHGQISETNVYNWFQNRRARTKRKQLLGGVNNGESELDTDTDSPEEKRAKMEKDLSNDSFGAGQTDMNFQSCDSIEHHQCDSVKELASSHLHLQVDNSGHNFSRAVVDGPTYATGSLISGVDLLSDYKPWEVPALIRDMKVDPVGSLVSQDTQGQMVTGNGAVSKSLNFLPNGENCSLAG